MIEERKSSGTEVRHLDLELRPDPSRTVIRPFIPQGSAEESRSRIRRITERILGFDDRAMEQQLARMRQSVEHLGARDLLMRRFEEIRPCIDDLCPEDAERRLLLGAYFSAEYAFEAAALFNPSIIRHPGDAATGADTRFILSLRGTGEGHLSSVTFRTGTWHEDDSVTIDDPAPNGYPALFEASAGCNGADAARLDCSGADDPSSVVLYPVLPSHSKGIEDLRLTSLILADGSATCIGTYTAVGDKDAQQELLRTTDFRSFQVGPVGGDLRQGKGMALFPRQVGGRYLALSRHDGENIWLSSSADLHQWSESAKILEPAEPWESVQIGNCGSPLEIDEGWLVLTHGVGVVRNYSLAAVLLDRDDPSKVLGRMRKPLIERDGERNGYVPNVVYSCGGLVRGRSLLLPYSVADEFTRFALVPIDDLVGSLS